MSLGTTVLKQSAGIAWMLQSSENPNLGDISAFRTLRSLGCE